MTRTRIIRWTLGTLAALMVTVAVGGFFVLRSRGFHEYVLRRIVQQANQATGGKVEIRSFDFRLWNLTANVYGFVIHGTEPGSARPLLAVDHIFLDLKLVSLIHHKVDLNEIIVEHPVVHLISDANGRSNIPQPSRPKDESSKPIDVFDLGIHHVLLTRGEVFYNQERNPLDAEVHDLQAEVKYEILATRYAGSISYRRGSLRVVKSAPFTHDLEVSFNATPSQLSISTAVLRVASSRAQLQANVSEFGNPRLDGSYEILVHTQDFRSLINSSSFAAGDVVLKGSLRYQNVPNQPFLHNALLEGKLESQELQLVTPQAHLPVRAIRSNYRLANGKVEATGFAADLLSGHLTAELNIAQVDTNPVSKFHADVRGISLETIRNSATSAQLRTIPLTGRIDASTDGGWNGSVTNIKLRSDVSLKGAIAHNGNATSVPLNGVLHVNYDGSRNLTVFSDTLLRTPQSTVSINGVLGDHSNLRIQATANDLREFSALAAALRTQPGGSRSIALAGTASLSATVEGSTKRPQITAQVGAQNLQVDAGHWRTLRFGVHANPSGVNIQNGSLIAAQKGQATFEMKVALADWKYSPSSPLSAKVSVRQMPVAQLLQLAGQDYPVEGTLAADVALHGSQLNPEGSGSLELVQAKAYQQPVQNLSVTFQAAGDTVNCKLQVKMPPGTVNATATIHPKTRTFDFQMDSPELDLAQVEAVKVKNVPLTGKLRASANGKGTFDNPQLSALIEVPELQVREANVKQIKAQLSMSDHRADLTLGSQIANAFVQAHSTINLTENYETVASLDTKGIPLAPLIALYKPVPEQFQGEVELHASAKGPLKRMAEMEAHVQIPTLNASYQQLRIANSGPIKVDYADSVVRIAPSRLEGTDTSLRVEGEIPLKGTTPPRMTVVGSVNLALLRIFSPDLESSGALALDLHATRSEAEGIGVQGQARLQNVSFKTASAPVGVQNLNGVFEIQNNEVRISQFAGEVGGGQLTAAGTLVYKPQLRLNVALNASGVRLRYPDGVRAVLDSNLTLIGTSDNSSLSGRVLINNVSFTQDFDLGDFIGQFTGSGSAPPSGEGFAQNLNLNISVQTSSRLNLVSSTVSLSGQVDLRVIGTAAEPVIVGRTDLTGGEVFLMQRRYQLVRGIINFTNPNQTEPVVNMLITTTVNQYNLSLSFVGPVERLRTTYTSDPPLPPVDVINLLARGQTTEEATPANLSANSVLAAGLASQVSGQIQKLAGISSLQIDPTLGGNGTNPTARIAIQQRVTRNFIFTFSTDVTNPESQVVQGEYQINNRWSMTAARTQNGGYAFDAKYHRTF